MKGVISMLLVKNVFERGLGIKEPFRDLLRVHEDMDCLFASLWDRFDGDRIRTREWAPSVEMYEKGNDLIVTFELPGVSKDDVSLAIKDDILTIKGERKSEREEKRDHYFLREGVYGSFQRSLPLPYAIKTDKVKAEYKNGILTITLPKAEEAKIREIKIDVN